ncbi:hypothetical protein MASSI9I_20764 [Massilia sp. 9I]|nr:hypothetical protein MASSI9I_20764 [Massilia sp. 9I]
MVNVKCLVNQSLRKLIEGWTSLVLTTFLFDQYHVMTLSFLMET